ncbi:hypothetical protein ACFE04_004158 [Oxalis oulophora]
MSQYLDCDQIQAYKCNKNLVVSLKPLPHNGLATYADEICCKTCRRKLMDPNVVDYCSILCKTIAFDNKENTNIPPFLSHVANGIEEEENGEMEEHEQVMTNGERQVFIVNHKEVVNAELALVERESESEPESIVVIVEDDQTFAISNLSMGSWSCEIHDYENARWVLRVMVFVVLQDGNHRDEL